MAKINNVYISTILNTMKTIKYIFLGTMAIALFLLTGCSSTQNLPYDSVYNSGPAPASSQSTTSYQTSQYQNNTGYQEGNVQEVNLANNNDSVPNADTLKYSKEIQLNNKNVQPSTNIYNYYSGLDFDNPYFGTSTFGWSLSNPYWGWGLSGYWNYPYSWYDPYFISWNYPYYSFYGWDYPYWGYPYSWYNPYNWYSPYYYGYFPVYYYGVANNVRYGHRNTGYLGGNIYRGSGLYVPMKAGERSLTRANSYKEPNRATRAPRDLNRPASETFKRAVYQKPERRNTNNEGSFSTNRALSRATFNYQSQERGNNPRSERPRYQKPKIYQSLDNRNPRSSKEYYVPQNTRFERTVQFKTTQVNRNTPERRYNVYRPAYLQHQNRRNVYRPANNYNYTPVRTSSPYRSNSTPRRVYNFNRSNNNSYRPTTREPARTINWSTGSGGEFRSTSGGGGSRPRRR